MIARRALLGCGLVLAPALVAAQAPVRRRIVLLRWDTEATSGEAVARFIARLGELGQSQGRNLDVDVVHAGSNPTRARGLLDTAIAEGAEIIVASSTPAVAAGR